MRFTKREEQLLLHESALDLDTLQPLLSEMRKAYGAPGRYYHNWDHALSVLAAVLELELAPKERLAHCLAAVLHDAVYVVGEKDNEYRSSMWARKLQVHDPLTHELILLTSTHGDSCTDNTPELYRDFLDCDILSIADSCWARVVAIDWCVGAELVPRYGVEAVREGRRKFLREWLAKPQIFLGGHFADREGQARRNLHRLISIHHDWTSVHHVWTGLT